MGNILCLSVAILFFLFLFLYNFHAYKKEGFNSDVYNAQPEAFRLRPMDSTSTNLVLYNKGKWNNSQSIPSSFTRIPNTGIVPTKDNCNWRLYLERYPALKISGIDTKEKVWEHWTRSGMNTKLWMDIKFAYTVINETTKDPIMWEDLQFETNKNIKDKMNDFSLSFWLYVNEVTDSPQAIFKITDIKNPSGCLGVWIWGNKKSSLFIQGTADGGITPKNEFPVPMKRAIFCTVVFSGNLATLFINGTKAGNSVPLESMVNASGNGIEIGQAKSINNYAIKDFNIYKNALGDDEAVSIYMNTRKSFNSSKVRYVKIQQQNAYLHVQELEVYNEKGVNVAKTSKPSASSNIWANASPALLIDGNKTAGQGWPNSNHTYGGGIQYIELDLNADEDVKQVVVYNRPDCCQDRLVGAKLFLYDANRNQVASSFTLTKELVQTYNIDTFSSADDANVFFKGFPENFMGMTDFTEASSKLLKKWSNIESFTTNYSVALPSQIKLENGETFNFYKYKPISLMNKSFEKERVEVPLDSIVYNLNTSKTLYYYHFDSKNKEYIHIPESILFKEKGCTFAMWFLYDSVNRRWPRLFDFGRGPGTDNVLLAILNQRLQFYVFNGVKSASFENTFEGSSSQWYHVAWTINPVQNEWKVYINGYLKNTYEGKYIPRTYEDIPESGTVTLAGSIEEIEPFKSSFKCF